MGNTDTYERPLTVGEVAEIFSVTVPTVRAWEKAGKLTAVRTPGNQRRFDRAQVRALLPETPTAPESSPDDSGASAA